MFYCAGGHLTADMRKMTRIPTVIREITNEHKVRVNGKFITVKVAKGKEIVQMAAFCPHCAARVHPPVVVENPGNPTVREHIVEKPRQGARRGRSASLGHLLA